MTADVGTPSVWPGSLSELWFFFDSGLRIYYTIRNAEGIRARWMLSLNIAPVVKNGLTSLFGLGN